MALVDWLENAIKIDRRNLITKSNWPEFEKAYGIAKKNAKSAETLDGGYVSKTLVLFEAGKIIQRAPAQVYRNFDKVSEMFESKKTGRIVYIRPKMEEEK